MNDAYAHVMQVQMRQDNTWGVTPAIVIDISHRLTKSNTFTFQLRPPLRSRSRVDFDEFFGQAGLH
jgi:hypothetical protein